MEDLFAVAVAVGEWASLRLEHPAYRLRLMIEARRGLTTAHSTPEDGGHDLLRDGRLRPVTRDGIERPPADPLRLPRPVSPEAAVLRDWLEEQGHRGAAEAIPSMGAQSAGRRLWWEGVEAAACSTPLGRQLYEAAFPR